MIKILALRQKKKTLKCEPCQLSYPLDLIESKHRLFSYLRRFVGRTICT